MGELESAGESEYEGDVVVVCGGGGGGCGGGG